MRWYVYKGHSNDTTLLQLTPKSVFKHTPGMVLSREENCSESESDAQ